MKGFGVTSLNSWIYGSVEALCRIKNCSVLDNESHNTLWAVPLKYLFSLSHYSNKLLQFDWPLQASGASLDLRHFLLAWAGWGLGTRLHYTVYTRTMGSCMPSCHLWWLDVPMVHSGICTNIATESWAGPGNEDNICSIPTYGVQPYTMI